MFWKHCRLNSAKSEIDMTQRDRGTYGLQKIRTGLTEILFFILIIILHQKQYVFLCNLFIIQLIFSILKMILFWALSCITLDGVFSVGSNSLKLEMVHNIILQW